MRMKIKEKEKEKKLVKRNKISSVAIMIISTGPSGEK